MTYNYCRRITNADELITYNDDELITHNDDDVSVMTINCKDTKQQLVNNRITLPTKHNLNKQNAMI